MLKRRSKIKTILKIRHLLTLCLITLSSLSVSAFAKTVIYKDVSSLQDVAESIASHVSKHQGNILVVFDIDDTLLESSSFVGGDTWYNWQRGNSIETVKGGTTTIKSQDQYRCLFAKLGVFYEIGTYHATETQAASIVADLQGKYDVMALTSRSPDYRSGTHRELSKANFSFSRSHLMQSSEALAYHFNDGKSTRPITYQDGIVMTTGLDKGVVLQDLLHRLNRRYTAIFFVDDSEKNIKNMDLAWQESDTLMNSYHYTHVDKRISEENILQSRQAQSRFNDFLKTAFPERYKDFSEDQCN